MTENFEAYNTGENIQQGFLKLPKILFCDKRYASLSLYAKVLYGMMLERKALSRKNGWVDGENRIYIYFTLEEAMELLGVKKDKCVNIFSELDNKNGCGLIEKKRQCPGKPMVIYVMNPPAGFGNTEANKSQIQKSTDRKNRSQDFGKADSNKNNINKTDINKTDYSKSYPISSYNTDIYSADDEMMRINKCRDEILRQIDYDVLTEKYTHQELSAIVEIMADCICSKKEYTVIEQEKKPSRLVKERLLSLDSSHIEYVLDCFKENQRSVHSIKKYLLTALYNAPDTIEFYYESKVRHDLALLNQM